MVFELNANNHEQRRALANAAATGRLCGMGGFRLPCRPIAFSRMGRTTMGGTRAAVFESSECVASAAGICDADDSRSYQPIVVVPARVSGGEGLDVTVVRSGDGKTIVLRVVNLTANARTAGISLDGFAPTEAAGEVTELAAAFEAMNTAAERKAD